MDMTLSQRWLDPRLNFSAEWFADNRDFFILPLEYTDKIWHPDPYIVNAKSTGIISVLKSLIAFQAFNIF